MVAENSSYRYDPLEGDATVVQNPEERRTRRFLYIAWAISSLVNILFIVKWFMSFSEESHLPTISRSPYAGLLNNVAVPFKWSSEYSDINNLRLDELWQFDGILDYGMVALMDNEVKSMSLLPSEQRFPWDPENKRMYVVNAYHGIHCLRLIYTSLSSYHASTPQKNPYAHIIHCLENLRQDMICTADDSPRYLTNNGTHSGENQVRFCRDFSKLKNWGAEHDACFRQKHDLGDVVAPIEKFKYCKSEENTEKYLDKVRGYFDLPSDWQFPEPGVPL